MENDDVPKHGEETYFYQLSSIVPCFLCNGNMAKVVSDLTQAITKEGDGWARGVVALAGCVVNNDPPPYLAQTVSSAYLEALG